MNTTDNQLILLGNYINNPDLFDGVEHLLRPQLFTSKILQESYKIIKNSHTNQFPIDIVLLSRALQKIGYSAADTKIVAQLDARYIPSKTVKQYVSDLFEDYSREYLRNAIKSAALDIDDKELISIIDGLKGAITNIELVSNNVSQNKSITTIFDDALKEIIDMKNGDVETIGFTWGIKELDRKTGGIMAGPNVVAAMPGAGKTSLVINLAIANCVIKQHPFLFFSLEMRANDLMKNIISNITEINSRSIREGNIDDDQLSRIKNVRDKLNNLFEIDETDGITWQQVEVKVRAYRKKHKIPLNQKILVAIDFIQKMKNSQDEARNMSKEERMETTMNELARIAKHENLSLIEISQFSRETGKREVPRPKITDLKGSAAIEQNAVLILLMYRPEYHGILKNEKGMNLRGLCEINIAKGRFVNPEPVYAIFEGKYSRFLDYEEEKAIAKGPDLDQF